jgi:hypothetical protein
MTALLLVPAMALVACSDEDDTAGTADTSAPGDAGDGDSTTTAAGDFTTIRVPDDHATIQEAVDAAEPGDLVLIGAGTYEEAVIVETEDLVIRGVDRNEVILDGGFEKENGFIVFSDGVAIENLTVRNFVGNGLFWTGDYDADRTLTGYRASYVTAHNNGNYGLYAFNATQGQFDNSYASGSPDASYYVGQCNPCDALLIDVVGENSQLGYSGTNSTGVTIARSEFMNNIIGVVPNSQDGEKLAPNAGTVIVGNYIHDNNNDEAPGKNDAYRTGRGSGVVLAGTENNVVERNVIVGNRRFGVVILPWISDIFGGETDYDALDNVVRGNYLRGAEEGAQLALALVDSSEGTDGNCFADNDYETALPTNLDEIATCDEPEGTGFETIEQYIDRFGTGAEYAPYEDAPVPDYDFESMPDAETAPPRPATDVPMEIDLDTVERPDVPDAD